MSARMQTVCVLGLGYVGLPLAAMLAHRGLHVLGVDVDARVVAAVRSGILPVPEVGLAELVKAAVGSGRLCVSTTPHTADAFIIAVPTPLTSERTADLRAVQEAVTSIAPYLRRGNLVVLESTVPPGTTRALVPILERSGLRVGRDLHLAYSPERVLPGHLLRELAENDRVIGGYSDACAAAAADLYRTFVTGSIVLTDATTAELTKLMENTFRDVNIAIANEFARIAERVGVDVHAAISIANQHPRVNILRPGPGVGGHCIPVDPWFLVQAAPDITSVIQTAREVNDRQPQVVIDQVCDVCPAGAQIAVLGLTYKADVADLRGSPAVAIVSALHARGYLLRLHDPYVEHLPDGLCVSTNLSEVLDGADAVLVLTDHAVYRRLTPDNTRITRPRSRTIIDTRECIDHLAWQAAGFDVYRLGVGVTVP